MKVSIVRKLLFSTSALALAGSSFSAGLNPVGPRLQEHSIDPGTRVIVILRDQMAGVPPARGTLETRAGALSTAQAPILSELQQAGARNTHRFALINALATTVSKSEIARLAAHPLVQAVVPDLPVHLLPRPENRDQRSGTGAPGAAAAGLCNTLEPQALQLVKAAYSNPATPQAQRVLDGNGKPVTGQGVKVAFIADGLDPTLPGFVRPDGSSVFFDYEDFSGDPPGTPTAGGEAFGDASSIAAQDDPIDISTFSDGAVKLPSPCNISIRGIAPGASLAGLKVFSSTNITTTSQFVQAIEYAVINDRVDVINESFGGAPFPDNANDPISLANLAAVSAGVTVVVSTGDAGTAGTIESPSTDPWVIAAGATTQYRFDAQTGYAAIPLGSGGYLNNQISPFSSAGFSFQTARMVDVVAPGDLSWALCSTNTALYTDCVSFAGNPTAIEDFGGTSESSPLTAGLAALVIQAYRSTHHGASPTPAEVKQIIMSTATDLGSPAEEQGAGLINALAAVQAALSVSDANGHPAARGASLLLQPTSAESIDLPGTHEVRTFKVTNSGTTTQHLNPVLQTLGAPIAGNTLELMIDPSSDPYFLNVSGAKRYYITQTFNVPSGGQHLDAAIAWPVPNPVGNPGAAQPIVYLALLDPEGRQANYSIPQGAGSGYGHVDVNLPQAGVWTAVIFTRSVATGGVAGPIQFTWAVEKYVSAGTVSPSSVSLAPGGTATLTAQWNMPAQPGDNSAAIRFQAPANSNIDSSGGPAEIPVSMRTLVHMTSAGAVFTGTLTGGNGRPGNAPTQTFAFDVAPGTPNLSVNVQVPDSGYLLEGLLVDPYGMQLSVEPNQDPTGSSSQFGLQLFHYGPHAGRWHFILLQDYTSPGNETSATFTARVAPYLNSQVVSASLPNSPATVLSASAGAVSFPVQVTNIGATPQFFFADARLTSQTVMQLPIYQGCPSPTLQGACVASYLPPEVSQAAFLAQSTAPINMDAYNDVGYNVGGTGAPDLFAAPIGPDTVAASISVQEVPWGLWYMVPSLIGPFPSGAPTDLPLGAEVLVAMEPFDSSTSSDAGDIWADLILGTATFNPLVLYPTQSGTINVTITPDPTKVGQIVRGYVYIDTINFAVQTGDEVVRIPYTYKIGP